MSLGLMSELVYQTSFIHNVLLLTKCCFSLRLQYSSLTEMFNLWLATQLFLVV